jgi:phage repressor protein C with HTH and peptisase S24 domain
MDSVRELVVARVAEIGETLKSVSRSLGRNDAYLQQFVHRGVPGKLPEDVRHALAGLLGVDEARLRADGALERASAPPRNAAIGPAVQITGRIPLFGQAVGGRDGQFPFNGNRITDIAAPPSLAGVPDAYAVAVVGASMEPRYFAGEMLFVNPRLPVRAGDFVVAQIATAEDEPPEAYVKRFHSRDGKTLKLEQLNPKKCMAFPADKVVSIHRIVMSGDG